MEVVQSIARFGLFAALLAGFGWLLWQDGGVTEALGVDVLRPDERAEPAPELGEVLSAVENREPAHQPAVSDESIAAEDSLASQGQVETFTFRGLFVLPDGRGIRVPEVHASMSGADAFLRTYEGWHVSGIQFEDVPHGVNFTGLHT